MKPQRFLQQIRKAPLAPGYLFLGSELFYRDRCRQALANAALGEEGKQTGPSDGLVEFDLAEQSLSKLIDEARTFSLFASERLIVGFNAEAALPRRLGADSAEIGSLRDYFGKPTPGVVVLIESTRYDWGERDERPKLERLEKFFSVVPATVRFERFTAGEALAASRSLARQLKLSIPPEILAELVEMLGSDMARLASDLEKLALYAGTERHLTREDIEALIPEARQRGMFEFSDALARKQRQQALEVLDTLAQSGEYWPMQITLLAAVFRQALAVKEQGGRSVTEVMGLFQKRGVRIWPARAKQVLNIARQFSQPELEGALAKLFHADRDLRRERPNDRIIMEELVVSLTA